MQTLNKPETEVAIVVENAGHAKELHKLLPNWKLETAEEGIGLLNRYFVEGNSIMTLARTEQSALAVDAVIFAVATENQWIDSLGPQVVSLDQGRMFDHRHSRRLRQASRRQCTSQGCRLP